MATASKQSHNHHRNGFVVSSAGLRQNRTPHVATFYDLPVDHLMLLKTGICLPSKSVLLKKML